MIYTIEAPMKGRVTELQELIIILISSNHVMIVPRLNPHIHYKYYKSRYK
jgi:hypothetical protein